MDDIYENTEEYNLNKEQKILIVSDDMIADMLSNRKLNTTVTELFIREKEIGNFSCIHYTIFCFSKKYYTDSTHHFFTKIPNKRELQQITFNH